MNINANHVKSLGQNWAPTCRNNQHHVKSLDKKTCPARSLGRSVLLIVSEAHGSNLVKSELNGTNSIWLFAWSLGMIFLCVLQPAIHHYHQHFQL